MRIALIADLHGNRPATLALDRDLDQMCIRDRARGEMYPWLSFTGGSG